VVVIVVIIVVVIVVDIIINNKTITMPAMHTKYICKYSTLQPHLFETQH